PTICPYWGNHQKLEGWLLENFFDLLKERLNIPELFEAQLKSGFITFLQQLFELFYVNRLVSESSQILFFKKQLKKIALEPSIVDEIARYLVPGSMLFLLELYANLLQREEGIKYLKKLQDTITEVDPKNFWNTLKKPELMVELWDHQEEALREWFDSGGGGIIEMATATGKTLVGLAAALDLSFV
ncbi:MAG: hypothetical protein ACTSWF_11940, partial [Candidatus Freyarchaeota archaeon]